MHHHHGIAALSPTTDAIPLNDSKTWKDEIAIEVNPIACLHQSSPYSEDEHCLDLDTLDRPNCLLALALTALDANDEKYATTPYEQAMNWPQVMSRLADLSREAGFRWPATSFYVVEFRSQLKPQINGERLFQLDKESHREAAESGGLLKYWFGSPDAERRNLATCLWRSKEDAVAGGKGPWHKKARGSIPEMYDSINVRGFELVIDDDLAGWRFEK